MSRRPSHPSALIRSLAEEAEAFPLAPKTLVASSFGEGSELLRALALDAGGWMGFEVSTTGRLASRLAAPECARLGLRSLDPFAELALVDEVLDEVLESGSWESVDPIAEGVGFRQAMAKVVSSLRLAGVASGAVHEMSGASERVRLVGSVLAGFERRLADEKLADPAALVRLAVEALAADLPEEVGRVILVPGLECAGWMGRFLEALRGRGASLLTADGIEGLSPPRHLLWQSGPVTGVGGFLNAPGKSRGGGGLTIETFRAAGVREELREVLRRAVAAGRSWDEVEIATPDPDVYGAALHALSVELNLPVSFGTGLPIERTRPGRAVEGYLRWIENGFPSGTVRELLEAGDLGAPEGFETVRPRALARRLRELRVGWGRKRYRSAIARERERLRRRLERTPWRSERAEQGFAEAMRELDALDALFARLDETAPDAPDPFLGQSGRVSAGELAEGLQAFLDLMPEPEASDEVALRDLRERLERVARSLRRPTAFDAALASLRNHLHIRVRAAWDEGAPPWKSTGGYIHLTDLAHAGLTGRPATFVVGLDAGRFPGPGHQDPLLLDEERRALDDGLLTATDGLHVRRFDLAVLASRVRGTLTLSYTSWEAREGRVVQPAPVLLDAYRLSAGRPDASFEDLEKALGPPRSAVPDSDGGLIDESDAWLRAVVQDGRFRPAVESVADAYRRIGRGLSARTEAAQPVAGPFRGLIEPRKRLDPRSDERAVLSAGRLEALAQCPLRYLHRYVLRIRPPEDTDREPDAWLDPLARGNLLHRVFESVMRDFPDGTQRGAEEKLVEVGSTRLRAEAEALLEELPAPSETVYRSELAGLTADLRSFAKAASEDGAPWVALEKRFGFGELDPVEIALPGGVIRLMGAVDRIDRLPEGLRIVDYKTGRRWGFGQKEGVFNGGRRLQHVLYTEAVERLLGEPVVGFEYHFPTPKGLNEVESFGRDQVRDGLGLVDRLMDLAASGHFLPTDESSDCRLCDYKSICRVKDDGRNLSSPAADWGSENLELLPEYEALRAIRRWEGSE